MFSHEYCSPPLPPPVDICPKDKNCHLPKIVRLANYCPNS